MKDLLTTMFKENFSKKEFPVECYSGNNENLHNMVKEKCDKCGEVHWKLPENIKEQNEDK